MTNLPTLYGCGSNAFGQLGIPSHQTNNVCNTDGLQQVQPFAFQDAWILTPVVVQLDYQSATTTIIAKPPISVSCGSNHSALIDSNHRLYTVGKNDKSQCGFPVFIPVMLSFTHIPTGPNSTVKFIAVSCGWEHTLALDTEGQVWAFGSNQDGQCGPTASSPTSQPTMIVPINKLLALQEQTTDITITVRQIIAGIKHSLVVLTNGKIIGWGDLASVGLEPPPANAQPLSSQQKSTPRVLDNLPRVSHVACGKHHTVMIPFEATAATVHSATRVYTVGTRNKHGEFGVQSVKGKLAGGSLQVHELDIPSDDYKNEYGEGSETPTAHAVKALAGWHTSGVLTSKHELYLWGRQDHGQIPVSPQQASNSHPPAESHMFKKVFGSGTCLDACLSTESGMAVIKQDGKVEVVSWGWNEHGNCGVGANSSDVMQPQNIMRPTPVVRLENHPALLITDDSQLHQQQQQQKQHNQNHECHSTPRVWSNYGHAFVWM